MNEIDFIDALTDKDTKRASAAKEFLGKMKTAGFGPGEVAAGVAGAGIMTGLGYLAMKPVRGKPSKEQQIAVAFADSQEAVKDQAERDGRPLTFREDITSATATASKAFANALTRHPGRGALLLVPAGAAAGLTALRMLKSLK